jgi:hypothetical protein
VQAPSAGLQAALATLASVSSSTLNRRPSTNPHTRVPLPPVRQVIALANLRSKATHSAQTLLSHFRAEGATQTWAPKGAASQTPHSKGQAMPKKLRYVAGLRGAPAAARMRVVSLELDLGQPHQF